MFVSIVLKSTINYLNSPNLLANVIVISLSLATSLGIFYKAHKPAAVNIPVCLMVPPNDFLITLSLSTRALSPTTTAPLGQHKLLEKHMVIES